MAETGRSSGIALLKETNHILEPSPEQWVPDPCTSLAPLLGDALPLPFEHHLALELGHRGKPRLSHLRNARAG
jgi:hypothetical protein